MQTNNTVSENHCTCSSIFSADPTLADGCAIYSILSDILHQNWRSEYYWLNTEVFSSPHHIQYFSQAATDINPFSCGRFRRQEWPFCREIHQCVPIPNRLLEYRIWLPADRRTKRLINCLMAAGLVLGAKRSDLHLLLIKFRRCVI
jgi:hypothetical protein